MNAALCSPLEELAIDCSRRELLPALVRAVDAARARHADVQLYPTGFIRLPFVSDRLKEGYFLHIWKPEFPVREPFYPTHTHINHIDSRIIYGAMVNRIWAVRTNPEGAHKLVS